VPELEDLLSQQLGKIRRQVRGGAIVPAEGEMLPLVVTQTWLVEGPLHELGKGHGSSGANAAADQLWQPPVGLRGRQGQIRIAQA